MLIMCLSKFWIFLKYFEFFGYIPEVDEIWSSGFLFLCWNLCFFLDFWEQNKQPICLFFSFSLSEKTHTHTHSSPSRERKSWKCLERESSTLVFELGVVPFGFINHFLLFVLLHLSLLFVLLCYLSNVNSSICLTLNHSFFFPF